jgi:hypothetical protein
LALGLGIADILGLVIVVDVSSDLLTKEVCNDFSPGPIEEGACMNLDATTLVFALEEGGSSFTTDSVEN